MSFKTVQNQLLDLPPTYIRPGAPFTQLIDAISAGLALFQIDDNQLKAVYSFETAQRGWLDFWGLLFGIPRMSNEADSAYRTRIGYTLTAGAGPAQAISNWITNVWGLPNVVTENLPTVGYTIEITTTITDAQALAVLMSLAYIRPAGVPIVGFLIQGVTGYLDTVNFLNAPRTTGAYLGNPAAVGLLGLGPATNPAQSLIPTLYLTDPTINPSLAA